MYRFSNTVIGFLNLFTLLASIPIIGGGLWMARSSTTCEGFLQTPLLVVGFVVLIISLAGFIGACFHVAWALWVYLVVMLLLIATLMGLTIFGFVVTSQGGGVEVPGRVYKEYRLEDYSPWLRNRIKDPDYWRTIRSCILGSKTCAKLASWTPLDYLEKDMSPIQSGCCKPPTSCNYNMATAVPQDPDCYRWNNAPTLLCYECDSCKAGVLEDVRRDWRKLSVLNIVMVVLLIGIYSTGCCAFQNTRRAETDYPYGENRMTKVRPRWDYYCAQIGIFTSQNHVEMVAGQERATLLAEVGIPPFSNLWLIISFMEEYDGSTNPICITKIDEIMKRSGSSINLKFVPKIFQLVWYHLLPKRARNGWTLPKSSSMGASQQHWLLLLFLVCLVD
ncbi:hypothetical protein POTOM_036857 [Populus tomentosa]|uniref:Tetraspanin-6 n=1 Tax=Populus tomentosa TaxID=118781 RepID=A0A8X8CNB9_POPTO|nr:hypothetical protein POTOM_036857 [Populus tomentosa]